MSAPVWQLTAGNGEADRWCEERVALEVDVQVLELGAPVWCKCPLDAGTPQSSHPDSAKRRVPVQSLLRCWLRTPSRQCRKPESDPSDLRRNTFNREIRAICSVIARDPARANRIAGRLSVRWLFQDDAWLFVAFFSRKANRGWRTPAPPGAGGCRVQRRRKPLKRERRGGDVTALNSSSDKSMGIT